MWLQYTVKTTWSSVLKKNNLKTMEMIVDLEEAQLYLNT